SQAEKRHIPLRSRPTTCLRGVTSPMGPVCFISMGHKQGTITAMPARHERRDSAERTTTGWTRCPARAMSPLLHDVRTPATTGSEASNSPHPRCGTRVGADAPAQLTLADHAARNAPGAFLASFLGILSPQGQRCPRCPREEAPTMRRYDASCSR